MSLFRLTYCLKSLKDITSEIGCCTFLMWHVVLSLDSESGEEYKVRIGWSWLWAQRLRCSWRFIDSGVFGPDSGDSQAESGSDSELADPDSGPDSWTSWCWLWSWLWTQSQADIFLILCYWLPVAGPSRRGVRMSSGQRCVWANRRVLSGV